MSDNGWLNPFRDLSPSHRREVARQRQVASRVRQRFDQVQAAYKELVNDPRYVAIEQELQSSLGEQLHQLVEVAEKCPTCAPHAVRVRLLNEVVMRPLHQLFMEAQRSRFESVAEPADAI